jgi:hypothetical protein
MNYLVRGLFALAMLGSASLMAVSPAVADHTLASTTTCNNGVGGGGGQGVICEVTIVNSFRTTGGSAVVTVHECLGSAGAPLSGVCSTTTTNLSAPVTQVTQCNGTVNGGGATLRCSVVVTNNFYGISPGSSAATVDQCIGSAAGGLAGTTIICDPIQSTTNATVTECNGSANGGTLVHLICTVTGPTASAGGVLINQCNNSADGGGALVECSAALVNNALASDAKTPPATSTGSEGPSNSPSPLLPLMILLALGGMCAAMVVVQRRSIRS